MIAAREVWQFSDSMTVIMSVCKLSERCDSHWRGVIVM